MGNAHIESGGPDGLYTVKLDFGKATRDTALARVSARLAALIIDIALAQPAIDAQQAVEDAQRAAVTAAINAYVAATQAAALIGPGDKPAYAAAQKAVKAALDAYTQAAKALVAEQLKTARLDAAQEMLQIEHARLKKQEGYLTGLTLEETKQAWCADLTEDATGDVATIEIPGENKLVIIAPAAPAPVPATDGVLTAREVQTPEQVFFNAAILPGWQKYKPTYRRGIITAIQFDDDTADVTLTDDKSSAQNLGINQTPELLAVPVHYMTCNAGAFEVGDACVVKFTGQDWATRKIVGFVDHPKSCGVVMACVPSSSAHRLGYKPPLPNFLGGAAQWDAPLKPGPMPAALTPITLYLGQASMHPGTTTWSSSQILIKGQPAVVSWCGDGHRYSRYNNWNYPDYAWEEGYIPYFGSNAEHFPDTGFVWVNGRKTSTPVRKIIAAALYRPEPTTKPDRVILRVCTDEYPLNSSTRQLAFIDLEKAGDTAPEREMTLYELCNYPVLAIKEAFVGPTTNGPVMRYIQQRPHFNQSATKIAALVDDYTGLKAATIEVATAELTVFFSPTFATSTVEDRIDYADYSAPNPLTVPPNLRHCIALHVTKTTTETWTSQVIHAVDFIGDEPVAIYAEMTGGTVTNTDMSYIEVNIGSLSGLATGTLQPALDSSDRVAVAGRSVKVIHTLHGQLLEKTYSATGSLQNVLGAVNCVFLGDLSKNIFAFGVAKTDQTVSATGGSRLVSQTLTTYNPRYEYSFWHKAIATASLVKLDDTVDGGYATSGPIEPATSTLPPLADYGWYQSLCNYTSLDASVTRDSHAESSTSIGSGTLPQHPIYYQYGAADPLGRVAYFGCGQYHSGMDVVLRQKNSELLTVPGYAPGDYPKSLVAPVFYSPAAPSAPAP